MLGIASGLGNLIMNALRKKPFTDFERSFLINLIAEHATVIENKKTDGTSLLHKAAAWVDITKKYNASSRITRKVNVKQLKKFWNNLKTKSREAKTLENHRNFNGGGPPVPDMDVEHSQVFSTEPHLLPVIKVKDSDSVEGKDDDDSMFWVHVKNRDKEEELQSRNEITGLMESKPGLSGIFKNATQGPAVNEIPVTSETEEKPFVASKTLPVHPVTQRKRLRGQSNGIEDITQNIMEEELEYRKIKNNLELEHLKKIQAIELEAKTLELEHKKNIFKLTEMELMRKIEILKK